MSGARRPEKLTPEESAKRREKIVALWNQGVTGVAIKFRFGVSDATLRAALDEAKTAGVAVRIAPKGRAF